MSTFYKSLHNAPVLPFLLFFCVLNLIFTFLDLNIFLSEEYYYATFANILSSNQIDKMFKLNDDFQFIQYLSIPILLLLKFGAIVSGLYLGFYLTLNTPIAIFKILKAVVISEGVFAIASLIHYIILLFFFNVTTLNDFYFSYPLSLINIIDTNSISSEWIYPLYLLNIFELLYILSVAFGIYQIVNKEINFKQCLKISFGSYALMLISWSALVVFFTKTFILI